MLLALLIVLCASPAGGGSLLVLNKTDATLTVLDPDTGETRAVIGTGIGPHEVAVSPDGKLAVVANYGDRKPGHSLTLVDLTKLVPIETMELGQYTRPHGIVFAGPQRILFTSEEQHALVDVDLESLKVLRAYPTEQNVSHMVALTADGKRAFVANIGSGSVSAIDLVAGKLMARIEAGKGSEGIDVTPDGREVWVGNRAGDTLSVIDVAKLAETAEIPCAKFPIRVKITPDGKRALVSNAESGDVAVFDVAARKEVARIPMGVQAGEHLEARLFDEQFGQSPVPVGILITPDGKRAFVANTNADLVTVLDLEKLAVSGRLKAGRQPDGLGWAPE